MGFLMPKVEQPAPVAQPQEIPATQGPNTQKPKRQSMPSFLGSETVPTSGATNNKSLVGQ